MTEVPPTHTNGTSSDDRLDSWKAIAAHLKRDVSTVQRWERREGMPVHRHVHDKLGSVYAFRHELDRWWVDRRQRLAEDVTISADLPHASDAGRSLPIDASSPRDRWTPTVIAALFLTAMLVALLGTRLAPERTAPPAVRDRGWVLVTTFANRTADDRFDGLLEHALAHELSDSPSFNVVPRDRIEDALRLMTRSAASPIDLETGREVALRDGAIRLVIGGLIERVGTTYVLTVNLVEPRDGAIAGSRREEAATDAEIGDAVRRLSNWTRVTLGERPNGTQPAGEPLQKVTTSSLRALRLYSDGEAAARAAMVYAGRWAQAEALFASAVAEDPRFASAHMWLAWAQWQRDVFAAASPAPVTSSGRHLKAAGRAMELMADTLPRERGFIRGSYLWMTNHVDSAIGEFEALVRLYPDDFWGLTHLSRLYRFTGRGQAVVEMNARLAVLQPNDPRLRVRLAQDVLQTSGVEAARPHVRTAVDLLARAPAGVAAPEPLRTWVLLFDVHELWLRGNVEEAAAALDRIAMRPEVAAEGVDAHQLVVSFYFTLGRLRRIEESFGGDQNQFPPFQRIQRAIVALARNDRRAVRNLLGSYAGPDPAPVTYLIRAGDLDGAAAVLKRMVPVNPTAVETATAELEAMRGNPGRLDALVWGVPPPARRAPWWRSLQTLADAHVERRDYARAIDVLELAASLREKTYYSGAHLGGGWIESQKRLADLYRRVGRTADARAIERELPPLLAMADESHAVLVELRKRRE